MPGPEGPQGLLGGGGKGVWCGVQASVVGRWCHSAVSCLLYFSGFSAPPLSPSALLLPRVWLRAVPTYGPYGRFCSRSARLSCTSVVVTVTGMPLSLAPFLCSCLTGTPRQQSSEPLSAKGCPRRVCLLPSWSLSVLDYALLGPGGTVRVNGKSMAENTKVERTCQI